MIAHGLRGWPLLLVLLAPGCMVVRGTPEIRPIASPAHPPAEPVPVHVDLRARVIENGIHVQQDEYREQFFHHYTLRRALSEAGVMSEPLHRPRADALHVRIQVEEVRSGPTVLEVASTATLRILPSWTRVKYRARAFALYRGRALPPFEAETSSLLVQNLLLLPVAPFFAPQSARARNRTEVIHALARHLAAGLNALEPRKDAPEPPEPDKAEPDKPEPDKPEPDKPEPDKAVPVEGRSP
jgi:hypothetical protein